jgi:hypothetical protein
MDKAGDLLAAIGLHLQQYGWHDELASGLVCLEKYLAFQHAGGSDVDDMQAGLNRVRATVANRLPQSISAGALRVTREEIWLHSRHDLSGFFASRHSIRQFSDKPVDLEMIVRAVRMAQKTPSVCNRQAARVYVFDNDDLGAQVSVRQSRFRSPGRQGPRRHGGLASIFVGGRAKPMLD